MPTSILLENITPDEFFQKMRELISEELDARLKPETPPEYITKQEAAEKLRSSLPTIQRLIKSGKIKAYRFGRRVLFRADEIESCLKEVVELKYKRY